MKPRTRPRTGGGPGSGYANSTSRASARRVRRAAAAHRRRRARAARRACAWTTRAACGEVALGDAARSRARAASIARDRPDRRTTPRHRRRARTPSRSTMLEHDRGASRPESAPGGSSSARDLAARRRRRRTPTASIASGASTGAIGGASGSRAIRVYDSVASPPRPARAAATRPRPAAAAAIEARRARRPGRRRVARRRSRRSSCGTAPARRRDERREAALDRVVHRAIGRDLLAVQRQVQPRSARA